MTTMSNRSVAAGAQLPAGEVRRPSRTLMLVSADAGVRTRSDVAAGTRPCPDFLRLEAAYGVQLLDWAAMGKAPDYRSVTGSTRHVAASLPHLRRSACVLSDGEHVGIPLSLAMTLLRISTPHLVIGHNLSTASKRLLLRRAGTGRRMDRVVVHSDNQVSLLADQLRLPPAAISVVPYGVDTDFWCPVESAEEDERLVVAAGREHRDYISLASACVTEPVRVVIADSSPHSPRARRRQPPAWPPNVERRSLDYVALRRLYATASVIVVPLIATTFPAGITAVLEAMSMAKSVVVSGTCGLGATVQDGETGLVVQPGDVAGLRRAIRHLIAHPGERRRLGRAARQAVLQRHSLDGYVGELARHMRVLSDGPAGRGSAA